ncbi:hypothetical protein C0081_10140 [Cohaesibacter celericrescens]|uniref:Uncharacterized protein n=1 Tax=Cohaesibacter celericrescens TaxID=2067669 RepID=A0A2N5XT64_9HYPH|nr:hypothetical protein C0081_10140 [Cohaesibacter celericrescens]
MKVDWGYSCGDVYFSKPLWPAYSQRGKAQTVTVETFDGFPMWATASDTPNKWCVSPLMVWSGPFKN